MTVIHHPVCQRPGCVSYVRSGFEFCNEHTCEWDFQPCRRTKADGRRHCHEHDFLNLVVIISIYAGYHRGCIPCRLWGGRCGCRCHDAPGGTLSCDAPSQDAQDGLISLRTPGDIQDSDGDN